MNRNKNRVTIDCDKCGGTGRAATNELIPCLHCEGDGWVYESEETASFSMIVVKGEGTDEQMQDLLRRTVAGMKQ